MAGDKDFTIPRRRRRSWRVGDLRKGMKLGMALVIYLLGTCLVVPTWCAVGAVGGADVAVSYATVAQLLTCGGNSKPPEFHQVQIKIISLKKPQKNIYLVVIL